VKILTTRSLAEPQISQSEIKKGRLHEISITSPTELNPSFDGKSISNNRLPYTLTLNNCKSWPALIAY